MQVILKSIVQRWCYTLLWTYFVDTNKDVSKYESIKNPFKSYYDTCLNENKVYLCG